MDKLYKEPKQISVGLNDQAAIVLFELLSRWINDDGLPLNGAALQHPSELSVLQNVLATLESQLVAPFRDDYRIILNQAHEWLSSQDAT